MLIGHLIVSLLLPLSIGAGERDGASAPVVATHAAGDEIGARVETGSGTTPSADGGASTGSGAPACQWLTAVIYGLPVVDIDLAGDGVLRRNHPVFGHRQYGIHEVCDGVPRRFAWVDERVPTAAELTSGSLAEVRRRLPAPVLRTAPESVVIVNFETWLGVDDLTAVSAGVAADGHHARVTATPVSIEYLTPFGEFRCTPGPPRPGCALSIERRGVSLPITARVTWSVSYVSSVGNGGLNPLSTQVIRTLPVEEVQTISR
ncbi:MAG: hypothetical protein ACO3QE_09515 [Ilumatobacteraceae bacterium]